MERYIWIGILNISFCFGHVFAQKPPTSFYADMDGNKKLFLYREEVSIENYHDALRFLKREYGEDSEQYKFLIPDTAKFMKLYGFPFFFTKDHCDSIKKLHQTLPIIAISYEQAMAYCQWVEFMLNKRPKDKYTWQCSLPEKADYEIALKKATITQKESLSPLQVKCNKSCRKIKNGTMCVVKCHCGKSIFGLTDNVAEYTQNGMIVEGGENTVLKFTEAKDSENPIGFRIKLTAAFSKKSVSLQN